MDIFSFSMQALNALDLRLVMTDTEDYTGLRIKRKYPHDTMPKTIYGASAPAAVQSVLALQGPLDLAGKTLQLQVDEQPAIFVTFSLPKRPFTLEMVVAEINAAIPTVIAEIVPSNVLRIRTSSAGLSRTLRILPGTANTELCLPEVFTTGSADAIPITADVRQYVIADPWYTQGTVYFYQAVGPRGATDLREAQPWDHKSVFPSESVVTGVGTLLDTQGVPLRGSHVSFYLETPYQAGNVLVVPYTETVLTTDNGSFALQLLRGATYSYDVVGSPLVGSFQVPMDPALHVFNVLSSNYGEAFSFQVQRPIVNVAERTRL